MIDVDELEDIVEPHLDKECWRDVRSAIKPFVTKTQGRDWSLET